MKIVFLVLLFILFVAFAIFIYLKYLYRVYIFEDLLMLTKYFKNTITFSKECLDDIFSKVSNQFHKITKKLLSSKMSDNMILSSSDSELIGRFFDGLGYGDVCYEINNLNFYEEMFYERLKVHKENIKLGNLYLKLIIGLGALIVILLI